MLDLKGIEEVISKLNQDLQEPGGIQRNAGTKHTRYSYIHKGKMLFSFGLTRSSKLKSMTFDYVPKSMKITKPLYRGLHGCSKYKKDLNKALRV